MSREIDERVVQMKFEKGRFERDIETSIYNLNRLKQGLDFKNASKGFEELDRAARNTDISALGKAAEEVKVKFGLLEVFALRVMTRISDAAINAGEKLVKSLTIDQVTPGWEKYAQKTGSVQTIMAATASQFSNTAQQMEVVNEQLNKLNWFTDETSYNFVDMVNNIGKFTSNNIALDQSVTAMQGIANWAAISGANAQEASRAMYNLAQALATGTVKLIDWKSIENANMATTEFKQTVIDIATEMGTLKKVGNDMWTTLDGKAQVSVANFNEGLSKGWFTNDVLMRALNKYGAAAEKLNEIYETLGAEVTTSRIISSIDKYTDALANARAEAERDQLSAEETAKKVAQAGEDVAKQVADSWGISLEEATKMLAQFDDETMQFGLKAFKAAQEAKTFQEAIDSVKDAVSTGWMKTFELLFGSYTEAKELWTNLANTLYDIFASSGDLRNEMLEEWAEQGGRKYFTDTIYASLAAIMSILTPIKAAWESVFGKMTASTLLDITKRLHNFVLNLIQSEESMRKISRVFRGLFSILDIIKTVITSVVKGGFNVLQRVLKELNIDAGEFAATLGDGLFQIRNWIKQNNIIPVIFDKIGDALVSVIKEAKNFIATIKEFSLVKTILDGIRNMFTGDFKGIGGILTAIGNTFIWLWNQFKAFKLPRSFNDVVQFFKDFWKAIKDNFNEIGLDFTWIENLFINFGTIVKNTLSSVNQAFNTTTSVVGMAIKYLGGLLKDIDWSGVLLAAFGVGTLAILWRFADALQGFAGALKNVTGVGKSAKGAFDSISGYFKALKQNIQANNILKVAISVGALAIAFGLISRLDWNEIGKGAIAMVSIAAALGTLSLVFTGLSKLGFNANGLAGFLLSLGSSILLFAVAIRAIPADNSLQNRIDVLLSILERLTMATVLIGLVTRGSKLQISGMLGFATSIFVLIQVMKRIGEEDISTILRASPVIIALMTVLGLISRLTTYVKSDVTTLSDGSTRKVKSGGSFANMIGIVIGLLGLISVVKRLGEMDIQTATQGVILAIPLSIMLGLLFKASAKAGQYASSAGKMMLFLSAGLAILIPVLKAFASMDMDILVKGGLTITALSTFIMLPLVAVSQYSGKHAAKAGLMILEIAGALAIIQLVVKTLGKIDLVTLAKGVVGVSAVIVALAAVIFAMQGEVAANEHNVKAMTKLVVIVGIISALIAILTIINPTGALVASAGIAAVFVSLGFMFKQMDKIELPDVKTLAMIVGMIGIIGLIVGRLSAITQWQNALGVTAAMMELIIAIGIMGKLLDSSSLPGFRKLSSIAIFAIEIAGLVTAMGALVGLANYYNWDISNLLLFSTAVSEVIVALGISIKKMGEVEFKMGWKQVGVISTVIAVIAVVLGTATGLMNYFEASMEGLIIFASSISLVLVAFGKAASIMGETEFELGLKQAGAMSLLIAAIGATLGIFSNMVNPITVLPLALAMSLVLIAIAGASMILSKFPSEGFVGAVAGLKIAGIILVGILGLLTVLGVISTVWEGAKDIFANGGDMFILIGRAIGGFFGGIFGGFAEGLTSGLPGMCKSLSDGMINLKPFFDTVHDLPDGILTSIGTLVAMVAALTASEFIAGLRQVPIIGGIIKSGARNLGEDFANFGSALKAFSDSLGPNFNGENVKNAAEAVSMLGNMEKSMGGLGAVFNSLINGIFGSDDFEAFGDRLAKLGEAIKKFAITTDGITGESVQGAASCAEILIALEKSLPRKGGALQAFFGEVNIGAFGERLLTFGSCLKSYSLIVTGITPESVEGSRLATQGLIELEKLLAPYGGIVTGFLFGEKDIRSFGERIKSYGTSLVEFSNTVAQLTDTSAIERAKTVTEWLIDIEKSIDSQGGVSGFWFGDSSFKSFGNNLNSFGTSLITFSNKLSTVNFDKLERAVDWMRELFSLQGFKQVERDVINAAETLIKDIENTIQAKKGMITARGVSIMGWIAKGLQNGNSIYSATVQNSAINMANQFILAFEAAMGIASPSLVMNEEGHWVVKGLAEGITEETSAEEAAQRKAKNLVSAFESELSKLTSKEKTSNLEFQLWQLTSGKDATEVELAQKQLELEKEKLANLAKAVGARKASMEAIAKISGESSQEYQEAYQSYLQAQVDMLNQQKAINETYGGKSSNLNGEELIRAQMKNFQDFMKENQEVYEFLGKTQEDLELAAYKAAYGLNAEQVARKKQYEQYMQEYAETFEFMGKTREELDAFAREKSGWENVIANTNATMAETAQIIEDNINTYSVDVEKSLEMATSEIIANATKKGSGASKAASSGGASLGNDLATGFKEKVQQALGGKDGEEDSFEWAGFAKLEEIMNGWLGDFSLDSGANFASTFTSSIIDNLSEDTQPIADALFNMVQNGIDLSGVTDLVQTYGEDTISGFINGIADEGKRSELLDALKESIIDSARSIAEDLEINSPSKVSMEYGQYFTEGFAVGVADKEKVAMVGAALEEIFSILHTTMDEMPTLGSNTMANYANGLSNIDIINRIQTIVTTISNNVQTPFVNLSPTMKNLGINAMTGFINGLNEKGKEAVKAAQNIAKQVSTIMATTLEIKSPSRVTERIGQYVGLGLANGITGTTEDVQIAAEDMAKNTISSFSYAAQAIENIINSDDDFKPVITPILDMDELKKQANGIPGLLNSDRSISLDSARLRVAQINASKASLTNQNGSNNGTSQTNYNFTQNNYSPKALSRAEIYRQTNNQFSRIKEARKR